MRNAIAVAAFAAGALAAPYHGHQHKRDVVTAVDYDMVTVTDVVYVTAGAPTATTTVAPVADDSSSSSSSSRKHHWNWSSWAWSSSSTVKTVVTSSVAAPAPSSVQSSTSAAPAPSSYEAPSSSTEAPATTEAPSSTWAATSAKPTSTQAATTTAAANDGSYSAVAVAHHNIHRSNHSSPDIAWDDDLAATAQKIADSCVYAHDTTTDGGGYGQNIAAGVEANNISAIITDLFYNGEVGWYDDLYGQANPDMTNFEHWGHFSQIVWHDTTHVGCATKDCGAGNLANVGSDVAPYFTVCNYKGPGNFGGEYATNVLKPKSPVAATADWNTGSSVN